MEPARQARLLEVVELLFFAYRDFTADPDTILETFGFGRAHHRVLHFVTRNPGLRVADLLTILRITKQSLSRVLKHLIDEGYIDQRASRSDRRARLLYPTPAGAALATRLQSLQSDRIAEALRTAGEAGEGVIRDFLLAIVRPDDRERVLALIESAVGPPGSAELAATDLAANAARDAEQPARARARQRAS